MIKESA